MRLGDGEAHDAHEHALSVERDPLGLQQRTLPCPLGQGAIRSHDPMPRNRGVIAGRQHGTREPRSAGGDVTVRADEPRRRRAHKIEDQTLTLAVHKAKWL